LAIQWSGSKGCHANDLGDKTNAKKLSTLLEKEDIAVWFKPMTEEQGVYSAAIVKIVKYLASAQFVTLADFHRRLLQPLSVFSYELK